MHKKSLSGGAQPMIRTESAENRSAGDEFLSKLFPTDIETKKEARMTKKKPSYLLDSSDSDVDLPKNSNGDSDNDFYG